MKLPSKIRVVRMRRKKIRFVVFVIGPISTAGFAAMPDSLYEWRVFGLLIWASCLVALSYLEGYRRATSHWGSL